MGPKNATTFQVDTNFPYNYRIQKDGTAEYVQEDDTRFAPFLKCFITIFADWLKTWFRN